MNVELVNLCRSCDGPGCIKGCMPATILNPLCVAAGLVKIPRRRKLEKILDKIEKDGVASPVKGEE
jgi:hypothetical protein